MGDYRRVDRVGLGSFAESHREGAHLCRIDPPRCHRSQTRVMSSYKDFWPIVAIEGAQMGQKSGPAKEPAEQVIKEIRRSTRRQFSAEEKIRIVLSGLRGEDSIAERVSSATTSFNALASRRSALTSSE